MMTPDEHVNLFVREQRAAQAEAERYYLNRIAALTARLLDLEKRLEEARAEAHANGQEVAA